jgi:hypothetical protein
VVVLLLTGALSVLAQPSRGTEPVQPAPHHGGSRDVVFLDRDNVVETIFTPCYVLFSMSGDGGREWTPYRGPVPERPCHWTGPGHPVGYRVLDAHLYLATVEGQLYLTMDSGSTWRRVPTDPVPVHEFNPRTVLCESTCTGRSAVQALDLFGPKVYELQATSGLPTLSAVRGTADGAIWLVGRDMHGAPTAAWSIDHGYTWATKALPNRPVQLMLLAACDRRSAYLLLGFDPQVTVFATTDGGLTWEQHVPEAQLPGNPRGAFCTANGGLVMAVGTDVWVSHDRGATFGRSGLAPTGDVGVGQRLLWIRDADASHATVTEDGLNWWQAKLNPE